MKLPADPKLPVFGGADYDRSLYARLYALFRSIAAAVNGNADDIDARATIADAPWLGKALGEPFGLRDDLAGVTIPPNDDSRFRFIKLTAADSYNSGVLTSESVSGSAPLVVATAVISLATSPLNGRTVNLWNTERRSPRAGSAGTAQNDQFQGSSQPISYGGAATQPRITLLSGTGSYRIPYTTDGTSGTDLRTAPNWAEADGTGFGTPRVGAETRVKSQGVTYYMRIL